MINYILLPYSSLLRRPSFFCYLDKIRDELERDKGELAFISRVTVELAFISRVTVELAFISRVTVDCMASENERWQSLAGAEVKRYCMPTHCRLSHKSCSIIKSGDIVDEGLPSTVEPPITDPPTRVQPLYKGH